MPGKSNNNHKAPPATTARQVERQRLAQLRRDERRVLFKLLEHLHRVLLSSTSSRTSTRTSSASSAFSQIFQDGIQNRLAVLWIVLESPSLTSITSLQLAPYSWKQLRTRTGTGTSTHTTLHKSQQQQADTTDGDDGEEAEEDDDDDDLFLQLLHLWDPHLHHHLVHTLGGYNNHDPHTGTTTGTGTGGTPSCIAQSWIPHWFAQDLTDLHILLRIWDVLMAFPAPTTIV